MRSQLSFNRRVVYSLAVLLLTGHSMSMAADKYTVSGEVVWPDEEKKKKPKIILKGEKSYDEKISKKGDFKIRKVIGGEYSLQIQVDRETVHEETITLTGDLPDLKIKVGAAVGETPVPMPDVIVSAAPVANTPSQPCKERFQSHKHLRLVVGFLMTSS